MEFSGEIFGQCAMQLMTYSSSSQAIATLADQNNNEFLEIFH